MSTFSTLINKKNLKCFQLLFATFFVLYQCDISRRSKNEHDIILVYSLEVVFNDTIIKSSFFGIAN
jgi:hypothetical protein